MRRLPALLVALALCATPVAAQETPPPAAPSEVVGLPRRAPQPRTMEAEWPVYAAFSVTWLGIVGYLVVIGRRSRRVAAAVDRYEGGER